MSTDQHTSLSVALDVYEGDLATLPLDVPATVEAILNSGLRAAYDALTDAGLGPCYGDVAPWETGALDTIGAYLLRFAASNAAALQTPEPPA